MLGSVPTRKKPSQKLIARLKVEMAKPRVVTSAQRRLVLIDNLRGYECSVCSCRFPETRPPPGRTQVESRRLEKDHREREPQWSGQKRPCVVTSKPAIWNGPGRSPYLSCFLLIRQVCFGSP